MKIDIVYIKRRKNYEGPLHVVAETVRVPPDIKTLNRENVIEILRRRRERRDYIRKNSSHKINDRGEGVLMSWSPVISQSALEFICSNF